MRDVEIGCFTWVTLAVLTAWKGVSETPVVIGTGYVGGDCGFNFVQGNDYLVYAYDNAGALATNFCLSTAALANAPAQLAFLQTQPALAVSPARSAWPLVCAGGGAGVLLVLLVALGLGLAWRRRAARPRWA